MIRMQDESDIQSPLGRGGGFGPVQLQQKIGGVRDRAVGFNHWLAFADAVISGNDHRDLRSQPNRFSDIGIVIIFSGVRIVQRQRRNRCTQNVHG